MKISFILKEHHLFDVMKFISEKNGELKSYKIKEFLIQLIIFSGVTIYSYFSLENIYITIGTAVFFIVFMFLFFKFIDYSYEKRIRKSIENYRKDDLGKKSFIEINEDYFLTYDEEKSVEYKAKIEKLDISENKKYIFLSMKNGLCFFVPKEEFLEEEINEIKNILKK